MNQMSVEPVVPALPIEATHRGRMLLAQQPQQRASGVLRWLSASIPVLAAAAAVAASLLAHGLAHAQVSSGDPCSVVKRDLDAEKSRDQVSATNVSQQGAKVVENAKKCMDRVRKIGSGVATPQAKIFEATLDSILSYLTNQACKVFVSAAEGVYNEVNGTVRPYVNVLSRYEGAINGSIPVTDVISGGGIGGGGVGSGGVSGGGIGGIGSGGGVGGVGGVGGLGSLADRGLGRAVTGEVVKRLPGYTPPPPTTPNPTTSAQPAGTPPTETSMWNRIGCVFGGSKCGQ